MRTDEKPVVVTETYPVSAARVWSAITVPENLRQWMFEQIVSFEPVEGFETDFAIDVEETVFHHRWKVLKVEPERKLVQRWTYDGHCGIGDVTFALDPVSENETTLTVTNDILESFPEDIPEFRRESCLAGWTWFLQDSLPDFLNTLIDQN